MRWPVSDDPARHGAQLLGHRLDELQIFLVLETRFLLLSSPPRVRRSGMGDAGLEPPPLAKSPA